MLSKSLLALSAIATVSYVEAELAHHAQHTEGKIQLQDLPSDWDDPADMSIVEPDEKGMMTGLLTAPNDEDVMFLRNQYEAATKYRERLEEESHLTPEDATPGCVACKKKSKKGAIQALDLAKTQLGQMKTWVELEQKREEVLPKLVTDLHKKAVKEYKLRLKAEEKLQKAVNKTITDPCTCIARVCSDDFFSSKIVPHHYAGGEGWCFTHGNCKDANRKSLKYCAGEFWATREQGALEMVQAEPRMFEKMLHAIARERFIDRIKAQERKRVADCAVAAADKKYRPAKITLRSVMPTTVTTIVEAPDSIQAMQPAWSPCATKDQPLSPQ